MKLLFRHRIHQDIIIILVLFAVTFFIVSKIVVGAGNNASLYLSQAAQWLNGEDFILIKHGGIRGNLFPIIIGVIFKIFGKDVSNATLLINTIFGCSLVLSYFIVRKWLGLAAGLAVPGLILSSNPIISLANTIDTDILIPFLLLSVLFLYHISLTKHNYLFSFLSGLVLGAAILIKESAILYTGFPILILFFRCFGGRLENFYRYLFFLLGTFLLVLPWAISIVAEYGNPLMLLGHATPDHQKYIVAQHTNLSATIKWVRLLTIDFFPTLTIYYTEHLKPVTPFLAPLIPFSWLWVIYNGIKNNSESDLYLFLSALPFLPIVLFVADFHYRIGQTVIIYYLSYFALISLLSKLVDILRIKSRGKWFIKFVENREKTIMLFAVFLILVQLSAVVMDKGFGKIQEKLFGSKDRTIGRFSEDIKTASGWILPKITKNSRVVSDGLTNEGLEFYGGTNLKIPVLKVNPTILKVYGENMSYSTTGVINESNLLFVFTYHRFRDNRPYIYLFFENTIIEAVKEASPDYLVFSGRSRFLKKYFNAAKWSELVYKNNSVVIYKIDKTTIVPIKDVRFCLNNNFIDDLTWLENKYPQSYRDTMIILAKFGLSKEVLAEKNCTFDNTFSY